jgi:hypothetical protein
MRGLRFVVILAGVGALGVSCRAADVRAFGPNDVDYSRYRTFRILPPKGMTKTGIVEGDPRTAPPIIKSIRTQLTKKGLVEAGDGASADLDVTSFAVAEPVPQIEALIFATNQADFSTFTSTIGRSNWKGSLMVNMIDNKTNKSIWAGIVSKALGKADSVDKDINKAATDLFKKYPLKK